MATDWQKSKQEVTKIVSLVKKKIVAYCPDLSQNKELSPGNTASLYRKLNKNSDTKWDEDVIALLTAIVVTAILYKWAKK